MNVFRWLLPDKKPIVSVRYKRYSQTVDLTGRSILLIGSRGEALWLFPFLADPSAMDERQAYQHEVTAQMVGRVADEVHEFDNARQGFDVRLIRLLMREGRVIEVTLGDGERQYPSCVLPA
jgi:hypothetical protein